MAAHEAARRFDLGDIVRAHRAELEETVRLTPEQRRVLTDIGQCRTAALGGHLEKCTRCEYEHPSYNSCRNRHCPKCQALAQERWIEAERARMLDVPHFHVVFTLPADLRRLAKFAPRTVYDALFRAAAETLHAFARSRLGAVVGATLVLHTWNRELEFHPHVHAIVTGGGLALDGVSWKKGKRNFLFPVLAMSRVFRAKMIAALRDAYRKGSDLARFDDFQDPEGFAGLASTLAAVKWYVYAKRAFARGRYVTDYLGRYTHRVGISGSRLVEVTPTAVTFRTRGHETATVTPVTFLRRFVSHVLPDGFHKIRHIGLYASNPAKMKRARALLDQRPAPVRKRTWREILRALTGRDIGVCPVCRGPLVAVPLPERERPMARAPPSRRAA